MALEFEATAGTEDALATAGFAVGPRPQGFVRAAAIRGRGPGRGPVYRALDGL